MLFYTHLVWTLDLAGFFGSGHPWLSTDTIAMSPDQSAFKWSWFYWIHSPVLLWAFHLGRLAVFALLTIGLWSRTMSVLAFLATISYINRASLAQFGLDDTNAMLSLYLMIGPCGAAYSVDRWLKRRRGGEMPAVETSIGGKPSHSVVAGALVRAVFVLGNWQTSRSVVVERQCDIDGDGQPRISIARWNVAGSLSLAGLRANSSNGVLGNLLLRVGLAALTRPIVLAIAAGVHWGLDCFWECGLLAWRC